jgi:hypothetical protein
MIVSGGGDAATPPDLGCGDPGAFRVLGRLDANGSCIWHKAVKDAAIDAVSAEGDVFALLARFNGSATIGPDVIVSPGGKRFVAQFNKAGTLLGSFVIADDSVNLDALAVDMKGGVAFKGRLDNGMADVGGQMLVGDSFLARLGPLAEWVWGKGFVGDAASPCFVSVGPMGSVFLFGRADGSLDFGTGVLSGGSVPNEDVVLAKLKP